jgi:hypothetical protein
MKNLHKGLNFTDKKYCRNMWVPFISLLKKLDINFPRPNCDEAILNLIIKPIHTMTISLTKIKEKSQD